MRLVRSTMLVMFAAVSAFAQQGDLHAPQPPGRPTLMTPAVAQELTVPPAELTPQQIERMQTKLLDWPQLGRYAADNATLGEPAKGEQRVVFYGDSITDGWGRRYGKFFPGKPYVNRGISGQTTPQMLARFQQDVLALHPAAVVILAGINDIAGNTGPETLPQIEDNFRSMVTLAKANHVRVVLSSTLPASSFPWRRGVDPRDEVTALNQWLESYCREQHLVFLNYYPALVNSDRGMKTELAADAVVHPNEAGYAVMQPLAQAAVDKVLKQPRP